MKTTAAKEVVDAVRKALEHVRAFAPDTVLVLYDPLGRWHFMDAYCRHPEGDWSCADVNILEQAADAVGNHYETYVQTVDTLPYGAASWCEL